MGSFSLQLSALTYRKGEKGRYFCLLGKRRIFHLNLYVLLSWPVYINIRNQKLVKIKIMKLFTRYAEAASLNDKQAQLQEDKWSDIHY